MERRHDGSGVGRSAFFSHFGLPPVQGVRADDFALEIEGASPRGTQPRQVSEGELRQEMEGNDMLSDLKRPPAIATRVAPRPSKLGPNPRGLRESTGGLPAGSQVAKARTSEGGEQGVTSPREGSQMSRLARASSIGRSSIRMLSTVGRFVIDEYPMRRMRNDSQMTATDPEQAGSPVSSRSPFSGGGSVVSVGRASSIGAGSIAGDLEAPMLSPRSPVFRMPKHPLWDKLTPQEKKRWQLEQWQQNISNPDGTPRAGKAQLWQALERKKQESYATFGDRFADELFITGQRMFEWFTPSPRQHNRYWTTIFCLLVVIVFFFMAGQYPTYLQNVKYPTQEKFDLAVKAGKASSAVGPQTLMDLVLKGQEWRMFDFVYLKRWGGRYGPSIKRGRQWWRWVTSLFIHESINHLLSNMFLWLILGAYLEHKYSTWRIMLLWLLSGVGGNFFSVMFEDPCTLVVGASGAVFGQFGLFMADFVLNFESIKRPVLRGLTMTVFLIYFIVTVTTEGSTSHLSHVGGLIVGLFPSFLYLPNFQSEAWEAALPPIGLVVTLLVFIFFPIFIYESRFSNLQCS